MKSQMTELYEKTLRSFQEGEIVKGTVVAIRNKDVIIDIGYKAEGILNIDEFTDASEIQEGSEVEVLFECFDDDHGIVVLSKRKADRQKTWNDLLSNAVEGAIVEGRIYKKVRGGFMVDIGMDAFLPASLVDERPSRNLDQFLSVQSKFLIVKINHKRKNIVVSRKDYLDKQKEHTKIEKLKSFKIGQVVPGRVKNITDFGVFIDLGSLDGLLHITDMSWGRIAHPSEMVKIGDEIEVSIIGIDLEKGKVSLGLKQKSQDPWGSIEEKFAVGTQLKGKVVNILPYGAFVELQPGIEGLVHISELSWTRRVNHPSELLQTGDEVEVAVLSLDKSAKKISLGMKQIQDNPWKKVADKYHVGDKIKGSVRNLTEYGAFVELEPGIDGLVHISDISWTHKVSHPSEFLKKGAEVDVMVLSVDDTAQKISLGMKQLTDDPWSDLTKDLMAGSPIHGKVARIANFGLFVELPNGVEGLVHISEIPSGNPAKLESQYKTGDRIQVSVLHIDHQGRKIALTMKGETAPLSGSR